MGQAAKMTRGGKRPGAGRPSLQVKRVDITLTLEQIEWLKKQGNASETIRKMLEEKMEPIMELTDEQKRDYAETCADAYVCQTSQNGRTE